MIVLVLLGAGAYVGWNIGANDTANCVGTTVGCGLISYRRAVILVSVFVIIGALVDGDHVMKTVGKGIINQQLDYLAIFVALLCSGIFVTLATFYRIPTSTSQADLIRHQVRDRLYGGAYMPLLREDVYKLVESLDMMANAAEKCCDAFLNQRPVVPESLKQDFLTIITISTSVITPLKHALLCYLKGVCPMEVSRQHAKDVGLIESKADSLDWDLTKKIFSSDLEYCHKLHLKICVEHIVCPTDKAEYAADYLEVVALKAMI